MRVGVPGDEAFPYRGPGWDLRDEPPEEAPVVTYRLPPEEIAARYGAPNPRTEPVRNLAFDPRMAKPMKPMTLDVLRRLAREGLTVEEIAERLGRTPAAVRMRAEKWGVELVEESGNQADRERAEAKRRPHKAPRSPEWADELRRLYVDEGRSHSEIGRIYGLSDSTVAYYLNKFGIRRESSSDAGAQAGSGPEAPPESRPGTGAASGVYLRIAQRMPADQARAALHSVAELVGSNPLMATVEIELRVRAAG